MNEEIWKQIPGYGGHYEASSIGRIRVNDRIICRPHPMTGVMTEFKYKGKVLKAAKYDKWGHLKVTIGVGGVDYSLSVHSLVLMAFKGKCPSGMEACHENGVASDNRIDNLRWDTHENNNKDRIKHGTYKRGENHPMKKITEKIARDIFCEQTSLKECTEKYGISKSQAFRIKTKQSWLHIHA